MSLKYVTITGADDKVDPHTLFDISEQFPFVEWGILWYPQKMGTPRYPTEKWIQSFLKDKPYFVKASLHICGVDTLSFGNIYPRSNVWSYLDGFYRVQLNFPYFIFDLDSVLALLKRTDVYDFRYMVNRFHAMEPERYVIIQANERNRILNACLEAYPYIEFLFDQSRGNGVSISEFPEPIFAKRSGYAGGIGPDNVIAMIHDLNNLYPENEIWIDMETGVRTNDEFDIGKVMVVLLACEEFKRKYKI